MEFGIVWLLRGAWLVGILPILIAFFPFSWLSSFHGVIMGVAKRGKTMQASSNRFSVPQKWFVHFYVFGVMWTTFLLVTTWIYAHTTTPMVSKPFDYSSIASQLAGGSSHIMKWLKTHSTPPDYTYSVWRSVFLLLLMEIQVVRRLYESLYIFNFSPSARMHIFGYVIGFYYYTIAPLSLCYNCAPEVYNFVLNIVTEFIIKGKNQMPIIEFNWWEFVVPLTKLGWLQWLGAAIFFWGWIHQRRCHAILGSLREQREKSDEYLIPHGDWFEIVSSPHYLAEIVLYFGMVIASGGTDLTIWLLLVFVVANLVFASAETHKWYLRKFENYPRKRLAIIPFLY